MGSRVPNGTGRRGSHLTAAGPVTITAANGEQRIEQPIMRGRSDELFEVFYLAQTLTPYEPGAGLTSSERAKINRATKEAREAGFTAEQVAAALTGWPRAMGESRITALGLAANLRRCLNASAGAQPYRTQTELEYDRAVRGDHR